MENTPAAVIEATLPQQKNHIETHPVTELSRLHSSNLIRKKTTEVDSPRAGANYSFSYLDISSTAVSIFFRGVAVYFNIRLAFEFQQKGEANYFAWTTACIVVPLGVTSLIHCYMCYEDGKFNRGLLHALTTFLLVLGSSIFLRYFQSLVYAVRCKRAELSGDKESQIRYYKLGIREESDVAFLRLFECFLESVPQKILQISIVLRQDVEISLLQAIVICTHFGSIAWCLAVYHRYVRYAQEDKYNINFQGHLCHLCWHFCISVSRSLCIAFVASIFPVWTLLWCFLHAVLFGVIIFAADRPRCPGNLFANALFCFIFGIVYLFTYISTRDGPNRHKYIVYYVICSLENIVCLTLFILYASSDMKSWFLAFYSLCASAIAFYCLGILIMILYYTRFHPQITARKSKSLMINNN